MKNGIFSFIPLLLLLTIPIDASAALIQYSGCGNVYDSSGALINGGINLQMTIDPQLYASEWYYPAPVYGIPGIDYNAVSQGFFNIYNWKIEISNAIFSGQGGGIGAFTAGPNSNFPTASVVILDLATGGGSDFWWMSSGVSLNNPNTFGFFITDPGYIKLPTTNLIFTDFNLYDTTSYDPASIVGYKLLFHSDLIAANSIPVPEPSTLTLFGSGFLAFALVFIKGRKTLDD